MIVEIRLTTLLKMLECVRLGLHNAITGEMHVAAVLTRWGSLRLALPGMYISGSLVGKLYLIIPASFFV